MVMLQAAMAVAVIVVMVIMAVVMIMVMIVTVAGVEEFRLDLENAIEIERATFQHVRQRDRATFGAVQFCIRIDSADPGFDFGDLRFGDEYGLVQNDDVCKVDLVCVFMGVIKSVAQPI